MDGMEIDFSPLLMHEFPLSDHDRCHPAFPTYFVCALDNFKINLRTHDRNMTTSTTANNINDDDDVDDDKLHFLMVKLCIY